MNALEYAIKEAYESQGHTKAINKVHLEFLKGNYMVPIEKDSSISEPQVLYLSDNGNNFLPVFNEQSYLDKWAEEIKDEIDLLHLTGVDLLKGLETNVFVCLNLGSENYKEFHPSELSKLKNIVAKFFNS